jgi:hypothetical protein
MGLESAEFQERIQRATTGLSNRIGEVYRKVCPVDGVALVDGLCKVCNRQIQPAGPDTSTLSDQDKAQVKFWTRRLKSATTPKDREKALTEIRALDPHWTPAETPKSVTERVAPFFRESVTIGPNGEQIKTRRLIEM